MRRCHVIFQKCKLFCGSTVDKIWLNCKLVIVSCNFLQESFVEIYRNLLSRSNFGKKMLRNFFNPIQDGPFWGCSQLGKKAPLPKICQTYDETVLEWSNLAVIPYLRKIQTIYKSRDTPFKVCWHQQFLIGNQQVLLHQEIQISIAS